MFEQALSVMGPRQGEFTAEQRASYKQAFEQLLSLTNAIRDDLIRRNFRQVLAAISDTQEP